MPERRYCRLGSNHAPLIGPRAVELEACAEVLEIAGPLEKGVLIGGNICGEPAAKWPEPESATRLVDDPAAHRTAEVGRDGNANEAKDESGLYPSDDSRSSQGPKLAGAGYGLRVAWR